MGVVLWTACTFTQTSLSKVWRTCDIEDFGLNRMLRPGSCIRVDTLVNCEPACLPSPRVSLSQACTHDSSIRVG